MDTTSDRISTMRLYGSAIALVSGAYSIYLATTGAGMTGGGGMGMTGTAGTGMTGAAWFMLALGVVVIVHGIALLTPFAARIGAASGPLMIAYAVLMLLNQAWMGSIGGGGMTGGGMDGGMNGMNGMAGGPGIDAGMVAIAVLMLASGIIMTVRREMMRPADPGSMG